MWKQVGIGVIAFVLVGRAATACEESSERKGADDGFEQLDSSEQSGVCSVFNSEGEAAVREFLMSEPDALTSSQASAAIATLRREC